MSGGYFCKMSGSAHEDVQQCHLVLEQGNAYGSNDYVKHSSQDKQVSLNYLTMFSNKTSHFVKIT